MAKHDADVIVIGAGFAGLFASLTLASSSHPPLILEARTRLGGRAYTHDLGDGQLVDLGCSFVHGYGEGNPMRSAAEGLGVEFHVAQGKKTVVVGAQGPIDPTNDFASLSSALSSLKSSSPPSPSASLASTLLPSLPTPASRSLARCTEIGAGVTLEQLSSRWHGFSRGYSGTDGAPVGCYRSVIEGLWKEVQGKGAKVRLDERVTAITDRGAEGVEVETTKGKYRCKAVICTIPLGVLQASPPTFDPPLERAFTSAIENTRVGLLDKVVLFYSEPWWKDPSETGTYILLPEDDQQPSEKDSLETMLKRTTVVVDNLLANSYSRLCALLVPLGATAAQVIEAHPSDADVSSSLHTYLSSRLPASKTATGPTKTVVVRWGADPYARGATSAPPSLLPSTGETDQPTPLNYVALSRSQWDGRLGFGGEHTDYDHRGSVVGALVSGEREGKRVVELLSRSRGKDKDGEPAKL